MASLLSSLIAVVYVWRVVEVMYLQDPVLEDVSDETPSWQLAGPGFLLLAGSVLMGLYSSPVVEAAHAASAQLFEVAP